MVKNIEVEFIGDPRLAIIVYRNVLPRELNIPERIEEAIGSSEIAPYKWMDALVGDQQKMPEYRDCVDCKLGDAHIAILPQEFSGLRSVYDDTVEALTACLNDYQQRFNIKMDYREAINYVRYQPGQHFNVHTDHGFSYSCTVSSVVYINDDYEGGELWFPYLDLNVKFAAGDNVMFPSTFTYAHASRPVISGTKYVAVTMFDYNDRTHKHGYGENIDGSKATYGAGVSSGTSIDMSVKK